MTTRTPRSTSNKCKAKRDYSSRQIRVLEVCPEEETECAPLLECLQNLQTADEVMRSRARHEDARRRYSLPWPLVGCKKTKEAPAERRPAPPARRSPTAEPPKVRPSQQPLPQLPPLELPADPKRDAKDRARPRAVLRQAPLRRTTIAPATRATMNEDGTGGHDPLAIGSGDKKLTRHAPVIWNVGYWKGAWYWDGRAKTLEDNAKGAWGGGNMGAGASDNLDKKAAELAKIPGYKKLFEAAFPASPSQGRCTSRSALAEYDAHVHLQGHRVRQVRRRRQDRADRAAAARASTSSSARASASSATRRRTSRRRWASRAAPTSTSASAPASPRTRSTSAA